jgi:hypothetical protein
VHEGISETYALLFDTAGNKLPYVLHMDTRGVYPLGMHYHHGVNDDGSWHEPIAELSGTGNEGTLFDPSDDDAAELYNADAEPIPEADEAKPRRAPHQLAEEKALKDQEQVQRSEQRAVVASQATNGQLTATTRGSRRRPTRRRLAYSGRLLCRVEEGRRRRRPSAAAAHVLLKGEQGGSRPRARKLKMELDTEEDADDEAMVKVSHPGRRRSRRRRPSLLLRSSLRR